MSTFVDPHSKILAHVDRLAAWKDGRKAAPITIEWDLTNRCDLGCNGCHFGYTHTRGPLAHKREKPVGAISGGDVADTAMVLRALGQAQAAGVNAITWTGGGEPTLHPDFDAIVDHAHSLGLEQGLYTHGGHLTADLAAWLGPRLSWAVVSLDCLDAPSYANYKGVQAKRFEQACQGIRNLSAAGGCTVGVSFLLDGNNYHQAIDMMELGLGLGADYVTFRPMVLYAMDDPAVSTGDSSWIDQAMPMLKWLSIQPGAECLPERFAEYRDWKRERPYGACYGIRHNTTITPNGKMWLCPNRREFPDSCLGDLTQESFSDIWARHPGEWTNFEKCRVFCRLHMVNQTVWQVNKPRQHVNFI